MKTPITHLLSSLLFATLLASGSSASASELGTDGSVVVSLGEIPLALVLRPQDTSTGQWKNVPTTWEQNGDEAKATISFPGGPVTLTRSVVASENGTVIEDSWQGSAEGALLMTSMDFSADAAANLNLAVRERSLLLSDRLKPILEVESFQISLANGSGTLLIEASPAIRLQLWETSTGKQLRLFYNRPENGLQEGSVTLTIRQE